MTTGFILDHVNEGIEVREFQQQAGRLHELTERCCRQNFIGIPARCGLTMLRCSKLTQNLD